MTRTPLQILVIDDDEIDRAQLKRVLGKTGLPYRLEEASSIAQGLSTLEHKPCDLLFLDYLIPGENGLEGIVSIHARYPHLPLVMMTGQGNEVVASQALKYGATDYIPKELLDPQTIGRLIDHAIGQCRLRQKLDRQREDLQSFTRILAHDLKAPSRHIRGFVNLIREEGEAGDPAALREYLQQIYGAAEKMEALIDTMSEYAKLDGAIAFATVSLQQVLEETLALVRPILHERGARVLYANLPQVYGHAPQLRQLFQNLILNGVKYNRSPIPEIRIAAAVQEGFCTVTVADNGIGIEEKYYRRIFEPFQRLHGAEEYEGSGIGLSICKKIVERHDGEITCESEIGKGTCFTFTLPAAVSAGG